MRKTIRNGVNRRAVYKFHCTGGCGRLKSTYVYERAKNGICATCERNKPDPNQSGLFDQPQFQVLDPRKGSYSITPDVEEFMAVDYPEGDSVDVYQQIILNKNNAVVDIRTIANDGTILRDFEESRRHYPLPDDFVAIAQNPFYSNDTKLAKLNKKHILEKVTS